MPVNSKIVQETNNENNAPVTEDNVAEVFDEKVEGSRALVNYGEDFLESNQKEDSVNEKPVNDGKNVARKYVPGLRRCPLKFPRPSSLNAQQHLIGLQILVQFSGTNKPQMTAENREKLSAYTV